MLISIRLTIVINFTKLFRPYLRLYEEVRFGGGGEGVYRGGAESLANDRIDQSNYVISNQAEPHTVLDFCNTADAMIKCKKYNTVVSIRRIWCMEVEKISRRTKYSIIKHRKYSYNGMLVFYNKDTLVKTSR